MTNRLTRMARELLAIENDFPFRVNRYKPHCTTVDDFEFYVFEQVWGSTSLGFSDMGGQTITAANTCVLIPLVEDEKCHVYFAGRFAYSVDYSRTFMDDVMSRHMEPVSRASKYKKETNNENS